MTRESDLFIEWENGTGETLETARPLRFGPAASSSLEGFSVSEAEGEEGGCRSLFCGTLWLDPPEARRRFVRALSAILIRYRRRMGIPRQGPFLICGVGNENASADALGPRTVSRVLASDPAMRDAGIPAVCAVRTGVPRDTGIDTADTVRALAGVSSAVLIVTVDSLCARSGSRLGTVAQITDCGLIPGSALRHSSGEISRRTMPCPVLSVGVPTVVRASALNAPPPGSASRSDAAEEDGPLFVSRADTDAMVTCYASLIAQAVNAAFTGNMPDSLMTSSSGA